MIDTQTILAAVRRDGIYRLPRPAMNRPTTDVLFWRLAVGAVYNAHVCAKATEPPQPWADANFDRRWPVFSHAMTDVIAAPYFFELALSFFGTARDYFNGRFPRLYSLNAFWTLPGEGIYRDTQSWHRDSDDPDQFTLFMYGTDVLVPEDGAHLYQRASHVFAVDDMPLDARVETVTGPAGTLIIEDTNGLHMALRPTTRPRLMLWARWSTANPPKSYGWDKLEPVKKEVLEERYPEDPELQEAVRLVVG